MTEPSGGSSTDKPRRPVVVPAIGLVAMTAIGVTGLLGGLNEAPDKPDLLSPGAVLDQGRYTTKIVESRVTVERGEDDQVRRFVEMVFDVTNKGDETTPVGFPPASPEKAFTALHFAGSLIKISPAVPKDSGLNVFAQAKGGLGSTFQLHPGVPSKVIVRYRIEDGAQPPDKITLDLGSFEERNDLGGVPDWRLVTDEVGDKFMPEIKARVTLPVKEGGTP